MVCCAGPTRPRPTPAEDWREATVDVVIPALNEAENIILCLASVARQTIRPRRIILVDDGSSDGTVERARAFCSSQQIDLIAIQRRAPIGKTPTIKRQAREFDSDVEFILDADTVLESDELYRADRAGALSGGRDRQCVRHHPSSTQQRSAPRAEQSGDPGVQRDRTRLTPVTGEGWLPDVRRGITNMYREVLYLFLQRFVYRGQMAFFGTTTNPVGCAVAYRRKYVRALFDYISPILGDDLTNSEDIFIGFSMLNEGYRNIQLDRRARAHRRAGDSETAAADLPVVILVSSVLLLLRSAGAEPVQDGQALDGAAPRQLDAAARSPAVQRPRVSSRAFVPAAAAAGVGLGHELPPHARNGWRTHPPHRRDAGTGAGVSPRRHGERRVVREPYRQAFGRASHRVAWPARRMDSR